MEWNCPIAGMGLSLSGAVKITRRIELMLIKLNKSWARDDIYTFYFFLYLYIFSSLLLLYSGWRADFILLRFFLVAQFLFYGRCNWYCVLGDTRWTVSKLTPNEILFIRLINFTILRNPFGMQFIRGQLSSQDPFQFNANQWMTETRGHSNTELSQSGLVVYRQRIQNLYNPKTHLHTCINEYFQCATQR